MTARKEIVMRFSSMAGLALGLTAMLFAVASSSTLAGEDTVINGAGATFPYPIYARWAADYRAKAGFKINYQAIGSGGGIAQIKAKTVDFGASDEPLKDAELQKAGLLQFPTVIGGVVVVVNLPGINNNQLKLSPAVLSDIFLGNVTKWNDQRIKADNADLPLPALDVTVAHRSDGSGTTYLFTSYLSAVSAAWKNKVGAGKAVEWPAGVGGKGNPGVAATVAGTKGAIGYVEYAYAAHGKKGLTLVQLMSKDGNFLSPSVQSFQSAAAGADWTTSKNFDVDMLNQSGESWPITGATYILVYEKQADKAKAKAVLSFFDWALEHGGPAAEKLDYVPLPGKVVSLVRTAWAERITADGAPVWTKK
jgi:phosphate transport system substrate-binding protein